MKTRITMLKVKIKSLAAEARIIRREELRLPGPARLRQELHTHRTCDVRAEQRASLLAYAFLRGRTRGACEPKCAAEPDWQRVLRLVEKFGPVLPTESKKQTADRLAAWVAGAPVTG